LSGGQKSLLAAATEVGEAHGQMSGARCRI